MRYSLVLAALGALLPARLLAQDALLVPPGNAVPNYDRVPIGQREGIEAGAFIARTDDAGAPWYNPAGLAQSERSGLNASANAYEFIQVTLQGAQSSRSSTRFSPKGTYFGGVIGSPVVKSSTMRLGFYYAVPVSWDPGAIQGYRDSTTTAGRTTLQYTTSGSLSTYVPGVAAGWRVHQAVRVGASLGWAWTNLSQAQSTTDRYLTATTDTTRTRQLIADGKATGLLLTLGAQLDAGKGIHAGLKVVTPSLRTGGSASVTAASDRFDDGGSTQQFFHDESARLEYPIPIEIAGGLAWKGAGAELEVGFRYHGSHGPFELLSSDNYVETVTTADGQPPGSTTAPFTPVVEAWKSVVNVQVGGNIRLNRAWRLHAGFYTDRSPVADPATSAFRSVNLTGTSVGVRLSGSHLSGSAGVTAAWGTTAPRELGPILGGESSATTLQVRTVTLLYSLAYAF